MTVVPTYSVLSDPMNPEVKKLWVAALRNPQAKQIKDHLATNEGNCCLGIACELAVREGVIQPKKLYRVDDDLEIYAYYDDSNKNETLLPTPVKKWLGVQEANPSFVIEYAREMSQSEFFLTTLNDSIGLTFSQIADIIEYVF